MFKLPKSTIVDKKIPKSKFYQNIKANTKLKNKFSQDIEHIIWKHKISKETINIEPTEEVQEIQIFEVHLKHKNFSKEIFESIDKVVPYPILFVLVYDDEVKLLISYKRRNKNDDNRFVIDSYYGSEWMKTDDIKLDIISGLNLKIVYDNILKSLVSIETSMKESIEEAVEKQKIIDNLKRQISRLESKIKREKQFNKKVKLNIELQKLKKELEDKLR